MQLENPRELDQLIDIVLQYMSLGELVPTKALLDYGRGGGSCQLADKCRSFIIICG